MDVVAWSARRGGASMHNAEKVCRSVLQCVAVCCSVLQCVAVWYGLLQCVMVCCSVLQCDAFSSACRGGASMHNAEKVCCSVL